jgi:hypothetical protein
VSLCCRWIFVSGTVGEGESLFFLSLRQPPLKRRVVWGIKHRIRSNGKAPHSRSSLHIFEWLWVEFLAREVSSMKFVFSLFFLGGLDQILNKFLVKCRYVTSIIGGVEQVVKY